MTTTTVTPAPAAQATPNAADAGTKTTADAAAAAAAQKSTADTAAAQAAEKAKTDAVAADKLKADEAAAAAAKVKQAAETKHELKLQEGSLLSEKHVAEVAELAKSKGYAPEVAQTLLDQRAVAVKSFAEENKTMVTEMVTGWKGETEKRFGDKLPAVEKEIEALVQKHGPPGFWEKLQKSEFRYEPDFFQMLANMASAGRDDKFVSGGAVTTRLSDIKDPQQRLAAIYNAEEAARKK